MPRPVSVITTVFNEIASIDRFLDALEQQTVTPDEIVVVDAGSTDGTRERLHERAAANPTLVVIEQPGNRSLGRNTAIEAASHNLIAATDGGCVPRSDWYAEIIKPFGEETAADTEWIAGFYEVEADSVIDKCVGLTIVYVEEEVDPGFFFPSARSVAFTKDAWDAAGRFPEHVEFGEDTLFDQNMIDAGFTPVFTPRAVVGWHPPAGFRGLAKTTFSWGRGDGAAHVRGAYYKRTLLAFALIGAAMVGLGLVHPALIPVPLLATVPALWKTIKHKVKHVSSPLKWVLLPLARMVATTSNLIGFLVGRYLGE